MGWKRKCSSPEPQPYPCKATKRDSVCRSPGSWKKKISTPTETKTWTQAHLSGDHEQKSKADYAESDTPLQSSSPVSSPLKSEEDAELGLVITFDDDGLAEDELLTKWHGVKEEEKTSQKNGDMVKSGSQLDESEESDEESKKLDRDLMVKSKRLKLSSINVRNIIHEVVTNEHVVAMMKAAIRDTQDMPLFEPKMTRSKLKEVVEKGVGMGNWNVSPIKKPNELKPPQFVDIPLEEEEDSSDEEYCPDEDEEDETAEETFLESDVETTASSPHGSRHSCSRAPPQCDETSCSPKPQKPKSSRHLSVEAVPMGPPAPPPTRSIKTPDPFIEKLHAVDKELELSPLSMEPYQVLSSSSAEEPEGSLVACRTRSKRPLRDVPLDQLEAELRAPDITPDMYDCVSKLEDREWSQWLQGLMSSHLDNEEEADEEDDPEYNFLDDLDEPDLEDYRNDRAVRITTKEVSELMEELFEMFHDDLAPNEQDEEGHEEDEDRDKKPSDTPQFNVPQAIRFEEPLAHMLTACRRTVREQLDALQQRRENPARISQNAPGPGIVLVQPVCPLVVMPAQRIQLQQQIQQHVQLLTQVNMLSSSVAALQSEAQTSKDFLEELLSFAQRAEQGRSVINPAFKSIFRVCNLQPSLSLLEELKESPSPVHLPSKPLRPHPAHPFPLIPAGLAWLFATRSLFLYPELLPNCSLDPALHPQRSKHFYTKGEDALLVLGLKHFAQTEFPYHLISHYLVRPKRQEQLRARVKDMASGKSRQNIIKFYCQNDVVPTLPVMCKPVVLGEDRPPVEREQDVLPNWLLKSLPFIHKAVCQNSSEMTSSNKSSSVSFPKGTRYPQFLPQGLSLRLHPSKYQSRPPKPKSRRLGAFSRSTLAPLAKAPSYPTAVPTQGVLLLTPTTSSPVLPLVQPPITPTHGTVPLNTPINFHFLTPELGAGVQTHPPASLPPNVVHIPQCETPGVSTGTVHTSGKQEIRDKQKKQTQPRKLATLKPAPQLPLLLPLSSGSLGNICNPIVILDQTTTQGFQKDNSIRAPGNTAPQIPETTPSQDGIMTPFTTRTIQRPSLKDLIASREAPAGDSSNLVLVQTISPTGAPQLLLLPQTSLCLNQPTLFQKNTCFDIPSESIAGDGTMVRFPKNVEDVVGGRLEKKMGGVLVASPLLALSESSCSPDSSMESGAEASVKVEEEIGECPPVQTGLGKQGPPDTVDKLSSGDEKQQSSERERKSRGNNEGGATEGGSAGDRAQVEDHGGEKNSDGEGDRKSDGDGNEDKRKGDKDGDDEEEDFDDLTQDEDEEEVMSSASEESVLSVPELQETMEKLTWLATERRLCREGDSEEDNSPTSPTSPNSQNSQNSQEENSEDEEDGAMKVDEMEVEDGEGDKLPEGDTAPGDEPPQNIGRGSGRGRGRGRPGPRSLKRSRRQERGSKDASKLLLLYDEHILDNDPMRESKDMAFAQSYLSRVREALQDLPGKVEEFLGLLYEFEQAGGGHSVVELFSQLKLLLRDWPELLKDFSAFLLPEQALECGLFEEQQAFDRSRRFLRQLEISFGENPSHYQKIVKALQSRSPLSPAGIEELKTQMSALLKGHTHLQGEFGMFFDEMRPSPARPGQFEEAVWPEDVASGVDGEAAVSTTSHGGGVWAGFEEVTLPDLEEEDELHKIRQMDSSNRRRRRKTMLTHGNFKECSWPEKECSCSCHDPAHDGKHRRHKRKRCLRCQSSKGANGSKVLKSQGATFPSVDAQPERVGEEKEEEALQREVVDEEKDVKDETGSGGNSPRQVLVWERSERPPGLIPVEQPTHTEEEKNNEEEDSQHAPPEKQSKEGETAESIQQNALGPASDIPVCAKNISLTPSGERVVLWTREADRVILTTCQQQGANQSTFEAVSQQLGNKTASEVSRRFRDLMHLFHTAASEASSEDETAEPQSATDEEQD